MTGRERFVVRRLLQTIPLLLGVLFLVFVLLHITPGDPARSVAGPRASPQEVERVREDLGLDQSLPRQYINYVGNAVTGDLGTSIQLHRPVTELIRERLPITLELVVAGGALALLIAVPLAQWAARHRDGVPDHAVRAFSLVALTMPAFWLGILLLILVAVPTGWFPISGYGDTVAEHLRALVLPSLTLAIGLSPLLIRSMRSELIGVRESDYIAMARASGIQSRSLALHHELPNVILPSITLLAVEVGWLLFGVVVVENTFGLPGLGQTMANAVVEKDFPVIQGITLVFAVAVVVVYLAADIVFAIIDPRIELR